MSKDNDQICKFDEYVNSILLIMFVVIVALIAVKGLSMANRFICHHQDSSVECTMAKDSIDLETNNVVL